MNRAEWRRVWHSFRLLRRMCGARQAVEWVGFWHPAGALIVLRVMRGACLLSAPTKQYLGDSVYAASDGFWITLTTENGLGPSNTIVLEPEIIKALIDYAVHAGVLPKPLEQEGA